MARLPRYELIDVAAKSDVVLLRSDLDSLRSDVNDLRVEMRDFSLEMREGFATVNQGFGAVNQRIDRLFLTLLVGMFGIAAALVGVVLRIA